MVGAKKLQPFIIMVLLACSACDTGEEVGEEVNSLSAAKSVLLDFRRQAPEGLAEAVQTLRRHETPEHFEEWGVVDGRRYFYSRDVYKSTKIVIHRYDNIITNVEER